jgi:iron(III) transport system substrate-binding protein
VTRSCAKSIASAVLLLAIGAAANTAAAQTTTLTAYTSLQKEILAPYADAFMKAHPDIQLTFVRDGGGTIHARLLAERDNPRADVIFGLPVTDIVGLYKEGLIEPYAPANYDKLKPLFRDTRQPPVWNGLEMYLNVICFNTVEAERRHLPRPAHWADLTNPVYKGQIAMPNPSASNTGYGYVEGWIESMGEDTAWKYMDALDQNVAVYTNSSSTPCKMAATGEYAVGLSTDLTGPPTKTRGAPIDLVIPDGKTQWDIEAIALPKGSRHPDAAKVLLDWAVTRQANEVYNHYYGIVGFPGLSNGPPNSIPDGDKYAAPRNLEWSIDNRGRILTEWAKRYDAKSEPRQN